VDNHAGPISLEAARLHDSGSCPVEELIANLAWHWLLQLKQTTNRGEPFTPAGGGTDNGKRLVPRGLENRSLWLSPQSKLLLAADQTTDPVGGPNARQRLTTLSPKLPRRTVKTCERYVPTALQQRPESAGRYALGIPRKADTPQWQVSRAETVQLRPRPLAPASVAPRSHHGFQHPD
jgi:hypothetical protein